MKDSPEKKLLENRLHNLIRESDTLEGFYKVVFSSNKNDKDIKEFLTTPKEREEYRQREINKLRYRIFSEKDPNEKMALESRMKYLIRESNQLDGFLENGKEFLHSAAKQAPEGVLKGLAFSVASKVKMSGPLLFLLTSEDLNSNEDAMLSDMRKKNIKDISPDEEKYIKDYPEYYEDENIASRINILKTEWNKTERNNDIANYYSNKGTDISRGLGSFVGDFGGMIAGGIAGEIAISKTTNTFRGNLNTSTNINNYKEFPNNSSPINSNTVSLNQEFTTINGLDNSQFSNQAEVVKTVNVKNPLQDVSNIVDWKPVKKVDSSGEYLMNAINDNKTNYYLDYKVAGYYASDIRNMTLTEMRNVGTKGWNKTIRILKGDAKDAYNFYRTRAAEIIGSRNIEKKFTDGSPVEQVLTEGFDKNGYKINFRNFSTEGEGNYPTIDLYNTNGKSKYEIKFKE